MLHRKKSLRRRIGVIALIVMLGSLLVGLIAAMPVKAAAPPLTLAAKSAILLDSATGQILFEQNADAPIPPASLTKLMTLHLVYNKIAAGQLKKTDKVNIGTDAWAAKMPGSSVMFLEPGQNVTVGELMKGLAIPSGNDAAVALADHVGGNVDAFVAMMNKEAQDLGFKTMHFADPAGLSPQNVVTAREYAQFARIYIQAHPEALTELHSVKSFSYPLPQNLAPGKTDPPVTQPNRNSLLGVLEGVDGLKTGFIDESGYNIAVTAKRGDMRLIGVILGVPGRDEKEGTANRGAAATALLTWGYQNFTTVKPTMPAITPVRVWKGAVSEVTPVPHGDVVLTVAKGQETKLTSTIHEETSVIAPVKKGDKLGELIFAADGQQVA
ncbi:MAG: D-alanyl-D-alanine carboxypeptidase [Firmicutes bacterium]|nr:D-alanyl-D-alanine carboxypeptidase [Bacillota bacterium]